MKSKIQYHSINTGTPKLYQYGNVTFESAVAKTKSVKPLFLSVSGMEGDKQSDTLHHGGEPKAVFFYEVSHYKEWELECKISLGWGSLGETVSTEGLNEKTTCIGDVYKLGEAMVQISQPRQPCYKLGYITGHRDFPVWMEQAGRTGIYARVLKEGLVDPEGKMELVEKDPQGLTVDYINYLLIHDKQNREEMERALENKGLSPNIVRVFQNRLKGQMEQSQVRLFGSNPQSPERDDAQ